MSSTKELVSAVKECKAERYYKKALEAIKANRNVVFIQDICEMIGLDKRTFNNYYAVGSPRYEEIMTLLENNKTSMKQEIRDKLLESKNATALIALYRLLGTIEEKNALVLKEQEDPEASKEEKTIKLVIN